MAIPANGPALEDVAEVSEPDTRDDLHAAVFQHVRDAVLVLRPQDERILLANPSAAALYGYSVEELVGRSLREMSLDPARGDQLVQDVLSDGALAPFRTVHFMKDGTELRLEVHAQMVRFDGLPAILSFQRDVSRQDELESSVNRHAAQLAATQAVVEGTVQGEDVAEVARLALDHLLDLVPAARASVVLFDYEAGEARAVAEVGAIGVVMGDTPFALAEWGDMSDLRAGKLRNISVADSSDRDTITRLQRRGLQSILTAPLLANGRLLGELNISSTQRRAFDRSDVLWVRTVANELAMALHIAELVQERQDTQELVAQQQRLAAVGELAAGVAHDFNNLLQGIAAQSELALDQAPPEWCREAVQGILDLAARGGRLTRQILDFSRHSSAERAPLDLRRLVTDAVRLLQRTLSANVLLRFDEAGPPLVISADSAQLEEALTNLVVNARDAMPRGGTIRVALESEEGHAVLRVEDQGTGIEAQHIHRVFEPFFTTKRPGHGTGLGLSQVYGIVQQNGGTISVENLDPHGAAFTLRFPVHLGATPVTLPPASAPVSSQRAETVLLVEDEPVVRRSLARSLRALGYHVVDAKDGADALEKLVATPDTQLVVTDMVMPKMGGTELIRALAELRPELPVVVMSGYSQEQALSEHERQVAQWLVKPFERKALASAVRDALRNSGACFSPDEG